MALLVYFRKVHETPEQVEYSFGERETDLDRSLVIDKSRGAMAPLASPPDPVLAKVAGRILARHQEARIWVGGGIIQS